jgi:siroheme synthase-like protein
MSVVQTDKEISEVPAPSESTNNLFPIFLKLEELSVLIVGGGNVGLEKLHAVLQNSPAAKIHLVAAAITDEIKHLAARHSNIELREELFQNAMLDGADIVIVAVNDVAISQAIRNAAKAQGKLVNVADKPELCDFYLSSVVKKGNLKIAISTNGKSPTAAKRLKEVLNHALPHELDDVIENLSIIRNKLNGNFAYKVRRLNHITRVLVEKQSAEKSVNWRRVATYSLSVFALMLIGHFIFSYVPLNEMAASASDYYKTLDKNFPFMVLAGFLAQLVDGALGMGYGVTSATILLSMGINLSAISGSIHTAEMFASGASGYSHYKFGNVNKKLFKLLVVPGVIGAIAGAFLLSKYGDTHAQYVKPIMAMYTLFLGVRIFFNGFRNKNIKKKFKHYGWLAGAGGFLDSFGGGGWGPIVTTTLITKGRTPRFVVGSVSIAEFFVTLASALTFFELIGISHWQVIIALIIGGLLAAPVAAKLAGKLPRRTSFILLGILVVIWSLRILIKLF